jgi:hypothetical protein
VSDRLHSIPRKLGAAQRAEAIADSNVDELSVPLIRSEGSAPDLTTLDSLMESTYKRRLDGQWSDRAVSDRWLAPRVHYALRLFRGEAAERGVWQWIAMRYPWYVDWRWSDAEGAIADDRWWGPVHKQAFARLWWGAEIFRDGPNYRPAERAFVFQDLPNSYLHRPVVRCRSLALAIVHRFGESPSASAKQVNGLARVLNLATAGSPPELETGYQNDDLDSYNTWVLDKRGPSATWDDLPAGPPAADTTTESKAGGDTVVSRGWSYAGLS